MEGGRVEGGRVEGGRVEGGRASLRVKKMTIFGLTSEPHRLMLVISHHNVCVLSITIYGIRN